MHTLYSLNNSFLNPAKPYCLKAISEDIIKNGTIKKNEYENAINLADRFVQLENDRILGIAENLGQFEKLTVEFKNNNLFFQEYIGEFDLVYKIYVIDRWVGSITSHNRLQERNDLSPLDLIHMRVPVEKQFKRRVLRLGRKLGMAIFGIDYIITKEGIPYIVDVNDFPSFRRIPEAVSLISDYIYNILFVRGQIYRASVKV